MSTFGIGSPVWVWDENNRVYIAGQRSPSWRGHFVKKYVTGETARSWIVGGERKAYGGLKLAKSEVRYGTYNKRHIALSEEDIDRAEWVHTHRYRIVQAVDSITDYDTLKKIAELVGYRERE